MATAPRLVRVSGTGVVTLTTALGQFISDLCENFRGYGDSSISNFNRRIRPVTAKHVSDRFLQGC